MVLRNTFDTDNLHAVYCGSSFAHHFKVIAAQVQRDKRITQLGKVFRQSHQTISAYR